MCMRCEESEKYLRGIIEQHAAACPEHDDSKCFIPRAGDYTQTTYWLLNRVHMRCEVLIQRMATAKELFEDPRTLPASLLREWEKHLIEAAEDIAKIRHQHEQRENEAVKGTFS